ncbi:MAG: ribonuclease Y [Bacillati bacterium ANGP1]|uniref:Ribonuclease Y n=1 Tax=Candidatus Segetimicrobium genomatis TaxID=2569760 RepID=A0A537JM34_9BACT|nr:MAG: ribonuclease Y [Terrabacteria group bacterium ANGP1]
MNPVLFLGAGVIGLGAFLLGYLLRKFAGEAKIGTAEVAAKRIIEDAAVAADREADNKKREALLEARDEAFRIKRDAEREVREQRAEQQRLERRLIQREETLDRKLETAEKREQVLAQREQEVTKAREELEEASQRQRVELERVAGLTLEQARQELLQKTEIEIRHEAAQIGKKIEAEARETAERSAREIVALAIQRCAADHTAEVTVSVVPLPNDEMKGRIIGREGRNIRSLESLTGVDLIIDDTPESVTISSFDPIRREVAKMTLEKLLADGRIHPARIEEMVEKAQRDIDTRIREAGERAAFEAGVHGLHPEELKLLGRLNFRFSYGQNLLQHSIEVALLAGLMATQLGADPELARRAGVLHDIGKALTHEAEGSHRDIGMDIARRYHEPPQVLNAIAYHHGDAEATGVESILVAAADAISASRPGARKDTVELYMKRLENLERIATSFPGVDKAYAIQAGREIRVLVKPQEIDDTSAMTMAREMAKKIEEEMQYPGQIKVTVLRETRAIEYAK